MFEDGIRAVDVQDRCPAARRTTCRADLRLWQRIRTDTNTPWPSCDLELFVGEVRMAPAIDAGRRVLPAMIKSP